MVPKLTFLSQSVPELFEMINTLFKINFNYNGNREEMISDCLCHFR